MVIIYILFLALGMFALIKGADIFVSGSSSIARRFNVPALIIGLTIVALGTSAPELAVSISASLQGSNEIAISNVVGSNLFNLLAILGICAVMKPVSVESDAIKRDIPFSIIITIFALITSCGPILLNGGFLNIDVAQHAGVVTRAGGIVLVILLIGYIINLIIVARKSNSESDEVPTYSLLKSIGMILLGIAIIIAGGQIVVYCAKEIARAAGMSETLIGLTVVAFGTSLPELVTSLVAIRKQEAAMAIGNTVGSNIFNILFILGVSAVIHPVEVNVASCIDMIILVVVTVVALIFATTQRKISRIEGGFMLLMYAADMAYAIIR
ncbi:calcium/sodium antiporter [Oribacterium sp. WCC10]|uniref:calcium/sodium antiporter n=1 Tax=Oribacterium sp. WCC10 TaxID=1855343 RepID=UPI0008ECB7A1|nr:calcium/sodium antiporter [Oribacterium sp. WCC10]SFG43003.1 cation:H+ antiporter [Oribacterium sp. WCC10]